jgi:hypothetical protein
VSVSIRSSDQPTGDLFGCIYGSIVDVALAKRGQAAVPELLRHAATDGTYPAIRRFLGEASIDTEQAGVQSYRDFALGLSVLKAETRRVSDLLSDHGTRHVILKGVPLAQLLHGDARARQSTDIDVLVDPENVPRVLDLLVEQLGYERPGRQAVKPWSTNQIILKHADNQLLLELHWLLAKPNEFSGRIQPRWSQTQSVELVGTSIPVLGRADLLLHLCLHAIQHDASLKTVGDLAAWFDKYGAGAFEDDWPHVVERIGEVAAQWPVRAVEMLSGAALANATNPVSSLLAWTSCEQILESYIDGVGTERTFYPQARATFVAKVVGTLRLGLSRGAISDRSILVQMLHPLIFGPHRLGRAVVGGLERAGVLRREDLFAESIFGAVRQRLTTRMDAF